MELHGIYTDVLDGRADASRRDVQAALARGESVEVILDKGLIAAMREVGLRFERQEYYVPQVLIQDATHLPVLSSRARGPIGAGGGIVGEGAGSHETSGGVPAQRRRATRPAHARRIASTCLD